MLVFNSYIGKRTVLKEREISVQYLSDLLERCLLSTCDCGHIFCLSTYNIAVTVPFLGLSRHHCLFFDCFFREFLLMLKYKAFKSCWERELQFNMSYFILEAQHLCGLLFLFVCFSFFPVWSSLFSAELLNALWIL